MSNSNMIYFDTASSYPILPEVKLALNNAFEVLYANSSSSHSLGSQVNDEVENVREILADEIGAFPSEIVFTSGATESNNIALKSLLLSDNKQRLKNHIITTQIEHKCIFSICSYLSSLGYDITYLKPDQNGVITSDAVKDAITPNTALVSVMHVNNELGTINPISEIGAVCLENDILFHTDAAQSFKKLDIDVDEINVDIMSFSAQKIGGPKGIGAIYIRNLRNLNILPVIHGAGQESGVRGGTVAAPLIVGFGSAIKNFRRYYSKFSEGKAKDFLLDELKRRHINYQINGNFHSLPSCVSLTLPSTNVALFIRDNEDKFCLAQGSACSSKEIEASHVLTAIGLSREQADKTLRISFPLDVKQEDILSLVDTVAKY
jgi:cysteine desulfurase